MLIVLLEMTEEAQCLRAAALTDFKTDFAVEDLINDHHECEG